MRLSLKFAVALLVSLTLESVFPADENNTLLEGVRSEIRSLKKNLAHNFERLNLTRQKTRKIEQEILKAHNKQTELEIEIGRKIRSLQELKNNKEPIVEQLELMRSRFAADSTARYALALQPKLKFLLNQAHSQNINRNLLYYDYILDTYRQNAKKIRSRVKKLENAEKTIQIEANSLKILENETARHLELLHTVKSEHSELIDDIETRMNRGSLRLTLLQEDETHLLKLIQGLKQTKEAETLSQPFADFKGTLEWPTVGRIVKAPGLASRQGGALWSGVLIEGGGPSDVNAVADGRIVFADWFRNLGRLVIVDHGEDYMSLYSNVDKLLVHSGIEVVRGDTIARTGKGDGESAPGLYFELRSAGRPLDPRNWCIKR